MRDKLTGTLSSDTQVPKYQTPAGPLPSVQVGDLLSKCDPDFLQWLNKTHPEYKSKQSITQQEWTQWNQEYKEKPSYNLFESKDPIEEAAKKEISIPQIKTPTEQAKEQAKLQPVSFSTLSQIANPEQKKKETPKEDSSGETWNGFTNPANIDHNITDFTQINEKPEEVTSPIDPSITESKVTTTSKKDLNKLKVDPEEDPDEENKGKGLEIGSGVAKIVGKIADVADAYIQNKYDYADDASSVNGSERQVYDAIGNSLMGFSPVGTIAGGAMKVLGFTNDVLGKTTDKFTSDQATISQVGGSYGGAVSNITEAEANANKKYGLLDSGKVRKVNRQIKEAKRQQGIMQDIAKEASDTKQAQSILAQSNATSYQYQLAGGYDQRYMRAAKEGAKIQYFTPPFEVSLSDEFKVELTDIPSLFKAGGTLLDKLDNNSKFEVVLSDITESFKQGGSIKNREIDVIETDTNQKSVIPEGALHKNKHHLDEVGIDDSELTKKGIPVVDNNGEQQAEIELNEIIFTLEVTKELESRYKEFYEEGTSQTKKDELAIEAGKLLWKEILYNTDDRTGLIDTLKKGGVIKAQEGTEVPMISLEDFINEKIKDRTEQAIQKATTRKIGYKFKNPNWSNCIATATDNYGVPVVIRNSDLVADPNKYGFEELQFNSVDDLPMGALIQDYNKPKDTSVPGHTIMYVGLSDPDKEGRNYPLYSYSSGRSIPEDMHHYAKYNFMRWDDKVKPRAYRYIGTPTERSQWEEEYYSLYPSKKPKHQKGGSLNQFDIDKMVKQALINILTNE